MISILLILAAPMALGIPNRSAETKAQQAMTLAHDDRGAHKENISGTAMDKGSFKVRVRWSTMCQVSRKLYAETTDRACCDAGHGSANGDRPCANSQARRVCAVVWPQQAHR